MSRSAVGLALGQELAARGEDGEWAALTGLPLVVLVGLTGVGKTTATEAGPDLPPFRLLPDRRLLTDDVMFPALMGTAPGARVADRVERMRLTARFRERHPGGMAELLSWLAVKRTALDRPLVFDGIRGRAEVAAAVALFPHARFLVLTAPPAVRLLRLLGRGDPFDGPPAGGVFDEAACRRLLAAEAPASLIDAAAREELIGALRHAGVSPADLAAKLDVLVAESRNYDTGEAIGTLSRSAAGRFAVVDTSATDRAGLRARLRALLERP